MYLSMYGVTKKLQFTPLRPIRGSTCGECLPDCNIYEEKSTTYIRIFQI